jgi:predicted adenylyl cyclase CyaB
LGIEIEAKMKLDDPEALEAALLRAGAERGADLLEDNTFFDTPGGSLRASDRGLRLRVEQPDKGAKRIIITHKGPRAHGKLKSRMETEVDVSDAEAATGLLVSLGFAPTLSFQKRRTRWELDGCHVEIDTVPLLGMYVEIEGPSETSILSVREKIGLSHLPLIRTSYIAMLVAHLAEHQIHTTKVTLEDDARLIAR